MPIYIYETISEPVRRFEVKQGMNDEPLKVCPETGEPVRRVITGGYGYMQKGSGDSAPGQGGGCCGHGGCGCH